MNNDKILLEVKNLKKYFPLQKNLFGKPKFHLKAVDDVSFKLQAGKTIGVVGESGCGKTTLGRTILQLYDTTGGKTLYYGHSLEEFQPKYYVKEINQLTSLQSKLDKLKNKLSVCNIDDTKLNFDDSINIKDYETKIINLKSLLATINKEDSKYKIVANAVKDLKELVNLLISAATSTGGLIFGDAAKASDLLITKLKIEKDLNNLLITKLKIEKDLNDLLNAKQIIEKDLNDLLDEKSKIAVDSANKDDNSKSIDKLKQKLEKMLSSTNKSIDKLKQELVKLEGSISKTNEMLSSTNNLIDELKKNIVKTNLYIDLEQRREKGIDLAKLTKGEMRSLRTEIQLIFQDPYSSLPPRMTVGSILTEAVKVHKIVEKDEIKQHIRDIMKKCGLQPQYYDRYPHEFSGGQRQRICIARALAVNPKLVICDEPVSALDVSIQAQIINLLKDLQNDLGLTYMFISHDLSVVKYITDNIIVMYLGNMMEIGDTDDIFDEPLHPYTQALFSAVPVPDPDAKKQRIILQGDIPSPANPPKGCKFHTRCEKCMSVCKLKQPEFVQYNEKHIVACHLYNEEVMSNLAKYDEELASLEQVKVENE